MKSREDLRNDYEEALFSLIMDDMMELEGTAMMAEHELLLQSDEHQIPDHVDERCISVIRQTFEENKPVEAKQHTHKPWKAILVAAAVFVLALFTAYFCIPSAKTIADDLIIRLNHISATLFYGEFIPDVHSKYAFRKIPDGFSLVEEGLEDDVEWHLYSDSKATIMISINYHYNTSNTVFNVDIENTDQVDPIQKGNFEGLIIKKGDRVHLAVSDNANLHFIQIIANGVEEKTVISIFQSIKYRE